MERILIILVNIFLMISVLAEFVKHVSMLQIANSQDAARRLFEALTMNPKTEGIFKESVTKLYHTRYL